MAEEFEGLEQEKQVGEVSRLKIENRKLNRQLTALKHEIEMYKNITMAQKNLNAVVTAEKYMQEKQLQVIMEYTPDIVILLDSALHFLLSTQSFLTLANISSPEFLCHKSFRQVFSGFAGTDWLDHMDDLFHKAVATGAIQKSEDKVTLGGSGTVRHYEISTVPFTYERDMSNGLLVIFRDLTDIIDARDQAAEAHYYREADRAKSAFLAKMSHEIRTPIHAIVGMSELALRKNIPVDAQEHILTIKHAGATLLSIVNDILDFSKIESGKLQIVPADYLFSSLVNDVVNIIKTKVLESRLRFVVNVDNDIPNELVGDATRIRQIMMNLLSNAIKYTERGYISLSILKEMANHSHNDTVILTITVEDSGKGIKEEEMGKLFNEFTRVDIEGNKDIEGTGLGLAITRNLVEAMEGTIEVKSIYGKGSTFTVTLPQKVRSAQKMAVVEDPKEKHVLIYERRELCKRSIIQTMEGLDVPYKIVSSDAEFYDEIMSRKYSFVFLASVLYERIKERYAELEQAEESSRMLKDGNLAERYQSGPKFLLIAEFGETVTGQNISLLTTPIYSLPVASFLNKETHIIARRYQHAEGHQCVNVYNNPYESIVKFTAPQSRILIVDDIETNLKVAEGLLTPYDMQVDVCKSGKAAIEIVQRERYDLIFMDHMMPEMNGIEATAKIRALSDKDPHYMTLPIVALTANAVVGTKEMFLENGFNDFLPKPIDIVKMDTILARWLPPEKQIKRGSDCVCPGERSLTNQANLTNPTSQANQASHVSANVYNAGVSSDASCFGDGLNINIDGLNTEKGIAIADGSMQIYLKILTVFYKENLQKIKKVKECLESGDLSLYTIYVHGIKGAAGNIGAEGISNAAGRLEKAAKKGDSDFVRAHSDTFLKDLEELLCAINTFLTKKRTPDPS